MNDDIGKHMRFGWKFAVLSYFGLAAFTVLCSTILAWTGGRHAAMSAAVLGIYLILFRANWKLMKASRDRYQDMNEKLAKELARLKEELESAFQDKTRFIKIAASRSEAIRALYDHFVKASDNKGAVFLKVAAQKRVRIPVDIESRGSHYGAEVSNNLREAFQKALEELKAAGTEVSNTPIDPERAIGEPINPNDM